MMDFLNSYSTLFVALLLAVVTFLEKRSSKQAKRENEQRLQEAREAELVKEQLRAIQKEEQARKDDSLDKTLKRMDSNITQLTGTVSSMQEGLDKLSGEFEGFKMDTANTCSTLGENGILTMKYSRGVASVTLDLARILGDGTISPQMAKLTELYESQEEHLMEGMFKGTIKK